MAFGTFFKHSTNSSNNDITFGCLIDACVNNGFIDRAEETFNKIQEGGWMGIKGNTIIFTTMIKAYSQTYQLTKALKIYEIMINGPASMQPNIISYNSLIDCCVRCGDMITATKIFEQMKHKTQEKCCIIDPNAGQALDEAESQTIKNKRVAQDETRPDLITYSTLIKGHCREKQIEKALILHEEMLQQGIKADEVLYNSLLDGCLKSDETELALKCFRNMKKLKIKPSNVTFSILAKIYQKMGESDKSLGILDDMALEGVKPGVFVYTCMIQTCIQIGQIDKAISMYKRMTSE